MTRLALQLLIVIATASAALAANPEKQLRKATKKGDLARIEEALASGADPIKGLSVAHSKDYHEIVEFLLLAATREGGPGLLWALEHGYADLAPRLLANGANSNDEGAQTPLIWAVEKPDADVLDLLLRHGVDVNQTDTLSETALMKAVARNHLEFTGRLMEHEADVNANSAEGNTALILAAEKADFEIVSMLIDRGGNPNSVSGEGHTALIKAVGGTRPEVVRVLLEHGANPNLGYVRCYTSIHKTDGEITAFDSTISTYGALSFAQEGDGIIQLLKESGAHSPVEIKVGREQWTILEPLMSGGYFSYYEQRTSTSHVWAGSTERVLPSSEILRYRNLLERAGILDLLLSYFELSSTEEFQAVGAGTAESTGQSGEPTAAFTRQAGGSRAVAYSGVSECGRVEVEVSFTYDPTSETLEHFKSENRCLGGRGTYTLWRVKELIRLSSDRSFYYETERGDFVSGRILASGEATGELSESRFQISCDDGFHSECTKWRATTEGSLTASAPGRKPSWLLVVGDDVPWDEVQSEATRDLLNPPHPRRPPTNFSIRVEGWTVGSEVLDFYGFGLDGEVLLHVAEDDGQYSYRLKSDDTEDLLTIRVWSGGQLIYWKGKGEITSLDTGERVVLPLERDPDGLLASSGETLGFGEESVPGPEETEILPEEPSVAEGPEREVAPSEGSVERASPLPFNRALFSPVAEAQRLLRILGYDVGKVDGELGPRTREAIRLFERDYSLPETGVFSEEFLDNLRFVIEKSRRRDGPGGGGR